MPPTHQRFKDFKVLRISCGSYYRISKLSELSKLSALCAPGSLDPKFACCLAPGLPGCGWLPAGSLAPWLPGCLGLWLHGSQAAWPQGGWKRSCGTLWIPGRGSQFFAPGMPETIPRENPADPGLGGHFLYFFKGTRFSTGGRPGEGART